jgi:CRISPR system Cascade subunit CasE
MTWITRAELRRDDAARVAFTSLLVDAGGRDAGHRLVWTLFADDPNARRDFLYREAEVGRYLIVSKRRPNDPQGLWTIDTKPYALEVEVGARLGFALRANPTRWVKTAEKPNGTRVDVVMHAKKSSGGTLDPGAVEACALDWLFEREAALGVRFDRRRCSGGGYRQVKIDRGPAKPIQFSVIDYDGAFEVVDPTVLWKVAIEGVAKAKAHGCGLLLMRRAGG